MATRHFAQPITAAHVRNVILPALDSAASENIWRVDAQRIDARVSSIFKAYHPGAPWPLAVKIYHSRMKPGAVEMQAHLLRRSRERMGATRGLSLPEVWGVCPEHRALVMQWIGDSSISHLLSKAGRGGGRRSALFAEAARWLSAFHIQSGIETRPLQAHALGARIERMLERGRCAGRTPPGAAFREVYAVFSERAIEFDGAPLPYSFCHGDFNPNNLFHTPGRTTGIDLAEAAYLPVTSDICRFLLQAETAKPFVTRGGTLGPIGVERADADAFIAGYGPIAERLPPRLFALLFLEEVLHRWATLFARPKGTLHIGRRIKHFRLQRMARLAAAATGPSSA